MRVLLLGNCQIRYIAYCLRQLKPEIVFHDAWLATLSSDKQEALRADIRNYDVIYTHFLWSGPFASKALREIAGDLRFIPFLSFTGFHPDDIHIGKVLGPLAVHHSAIIVSSYLLGLSKARCANLFNTFIYESLGYFDRFYEAKNFFLRPGNQHDVHLDPYFDTWPQPFMHNVNHPKFEPLATVAELLAQQFPGSVKDVEWSSSEALKLFNEQKFASWPVYPEIASRHGLPVEEIRFRHPHTSRGLSLLQFVDRCYDLYERTDKNILTSAVKVELPILRQLVRV